MKHYLETAESVFEWANSSPEGLTVQAAEDRLAADGKNKLEEAKKASLAKRFFKQLLDPMIIILLAAAALSAAIAVIEGDFPADVLIILAVVLINAVLGVYQEGKAEKAIEALQKMSAATSKVLRGGQVTVVKSEDIAVGDVVLLEAGDAVPADCRIFESASLKIEEAALTGESVPVGKIIGILNGGQSGEVALGDRKNMAYMGSSVVYGRGKAVVTATGMGTEMGKIAHAIASAKDSLTPLQIKLNQLSGILSKLVIGISVFIFGFRMMMQYASGSPIDLDFGLSIFMIAVSLAVAAIPEGLVAVVTIVLSVGVTNMSRRNAIIRKLTAVETLGCAQIICSDKTGTLTQNKMTVTAHYGADEQLLARGMALCTDAEIDEQGAVTGEPTEAALVSYALGLDLDKNALKKQYPRVGEAPFDSMRKMMSTLHESGGEIVQFTKGAPDEILKKCSHALIDGETVEMDENLARMILGENKAMADRALRVLALAYKHYPELPTSLEPEAIESGMVFAGLTGMIDPVRPEVKAAIEECRSAGITPVMITGDHLDTAAAIALELGIIGDRSEAVTGAQLEQMSEEEFDLRVADIFVYARVQPEHKVRIVSAWKKRGMTTAMTGDGVNDAPSIKTADIGVGMGITGTDVTKNVADMVLADDNFATIVSAVSEGRRIYDNIRKAIQFLLASNLSEIISIFFATVFGFIILKPVHLLWINLITDSLPALALGMEKPEKDIMKRKPRAAGEGIFAGGMGFDIFYQGLIVSVLTVAAYFIGERLETGLWQIIPLPGESSDGITMAFLTMAMCEIFHSFNMRSQRNSVFSPAFKGSHNVFLYLAMIASLVLTSVVIYIPFLARAFDFVPLTLPEYLISMALALTVIPTVEFVKLLKRAAARRKQPGG
ncbi:MAG TPA: cation-translocating P-type ATPase [Clostridiales bacterium]|nr:MAG: Calcium-transporting ATPase 1 [Firmicutes bacterium ADurb.Bin262]HQK73380.1 cation-translocating P-type ATPase [Clostridiales bacterium]